MPRQYKSRPAIIVIGPSIAYLPLTQDQYALLDSEDAERVSAMSWYALWSKFTGSYYAIGWKNPHKIKLHRFIMGFAHGNKRSVDHDNGNTLDFRKTNLRDATKKQNNHNCKKNRRNTSGFKGVHRNQGGRWVARISIDRKREYLGAFDTPEEAHVAYCAAAIKCHGEFARFA